MEIETAEVMLDSAKAVANAKAAFQFAVLDDFINLPNPATSNDVYLLGTKLGRSAEENATSQMESTRDDAIEDALDIADELEAVKKTWHRKEAQSRFEYTAGKWATEEGNEEGSLVKDGIIQLERRTPMELLTYEVRLKTLWTLTSFREMKRIGYASMVLESYQQWHSCRESSSP